MDPDTKDKPQPKTRPRAIRLGTIQRFPFGSGATNSLNTPPPPPPCYVHHLLIREEWPGDKPGAMEQNKTQRSPLQIARDIEKLQKGLEDANYRLDNMVLKASEDVWSKKTNLPQIGVMSEAEKYDVGTRKIKEEILLIQEKLIKLDLERIAAQSKLAPYKQPSGVREFTIVEYIPQNIQDYIDQAEAKLRPLRAKLDAALDEWFEAHTEHEEVKKELRSFAKAKQKLADARDKARAEYELACRQQGEKKSEAERNKKELAIKKTFSLDAKSKLERAQKSKAAGREKFEAAQREYRDFAFLAYGRIKTREKELYKKLIAKLQEVHNLTTQMGVIERQAQAAKNTLVSGSKIQMISFEEGLDFRTRADWSKKVPTVELEVGGKTPIFPPRGSSCKDDPPKFNGPRRHPHLQVTEPEGKLERHNATGVPNTRFKIFEIHRKIFAPTKTGLVAYIGFALSSFIGVFQHIFSAFPKKRYYQVLAQACGFMPTGMNVPDKLEAEIEVFPADSYTLSIKTLPGFGYDNVMRDEKLSDTTHIQGEVAYSDAENAASNRDHTVSSSESMSVFGVVQSSTTTSVTHGADGREIQTVTTLSRDGIFGSATVKDVSTGTFTDSETGATNTYSSTMERTQTLGSPLTDSEKLVSLQQTHTDEQGNVTDTSKSVVDGVATAIEDDSSGQDAGTTSARPPMAPGNYLPQIPIDLVLSRNGIEDPITQELRLTLGLIIYLVRKCADIIGRMGNWMPAVGWRWGFNMTFLTGNFSYTHDYKEHVDYRVWLHHKFDLDINLVTAKAYVFGGAGIELLLFTFQIGLEIYLKGLIDVKGQFEKMHPDAEKGWEIGFGPTGGIGIGAEAKAIAGQPDWISATGTIESMLSVEAMYWMRKNGEPSPYLDASFKWEGVTLKGVAHIMLVGHWEAEIKLCDEREIWSGRFPKEQKEEEIKKMLEAQNKELDDSYKKRVKDANDFEKKLIKKGIKPAKIKK